MALSRPGEEDEMSFMRAHGRAFGTTHVTITPGQIKPHREQLTVEAVVQPSTIFVDVETPIYDGDRIEWDDPRGGREQGYVTAVEVYNQGSSSVRHSEVKYTSKLPPAAAPASQGATVINVRGSRNVNIGLGGSTITQQISVSPGYEKLADDVGKALAVIEDTAGVDPDEVDAARDSVTLVLQEVAKDLPDEKLIKRALTVVKGVLTSAANAGAGALASGLIGQLVLGG